MADARLSATVLLLRDRVAGGLELFMVRRALQASFMPGAYVFPGGQVDLADGQAESICAPVDWGALGKRLGLTARVVQAVLVAGVRECFEEAGVLLAHGPALANAAGWADLAAERFAVRAGRRRLLDLAQEQGLSLAVDRCAVFAHWITPAAQAKRFDTYFLVVPHPAGQDPLHDKSETIASTWIAPREALERHQQREFPLAPPTFYTLGELSAYTSTQEVLEAAPQRALPALEPRMELLAGESTMLFPGDPRYPPVRDRGLISGPTRLVLKDECWEPRYGDGSPATEWL